MQVHASSVSPALSVLPTCLSLAGLATIATGASWLLYQSFLCVQSRCLLSSSESLRSSFCEPHHRFRLLTKKTPFQNRHEDGGRQQVYCLSYPACHPLT